MRCDDGIIKVLRFLLVVADVVSLNGIILSSCCWLKNKLAAARRKMERSMLNITYRDRKTNIGVREKAKVTDVIEQVRRRKWTWAGHVSRILDNRWTLRTTSWKPYERKRPRGRPARRWRDELDDYWKGTIWQRITPDRQMWKQHAEVFVQPRDTMAAQ